MSELETEHPSCKIRIIPNLETINTSLYGLKSDSIIDRLKLEIKDIPSEILMQSQNCEHISITCDPAVMRMNSEE